MRSGDAWIRFWLSALITCGDVADRKPRCGNCSETARIWKGTIIVGTAFSPFMHTLVLRETLLERNITAQRIHLLSGTLKTIL
jgi:hypothetical protein